MSAPKLDIAGRTDPGCVRERNEDSLALEPRFGLLVVADGMGGHNSGEVASALATETILSAARTALEAGPTPSDGETPAARRARQITDFVSAANKTIFDKAQAFPKDHGMGTTVVAVLADERSLTVGHVGDSRLYLFRNGSLRLITEDHSLVMDQVRHGLLTIEQAEKSSLQNILTRALGTEAAVSVDVQELPLEPGDTVMLCSDGLTKMLSDVEVSKVLGESATARAAVDTLIELSREAGGVDNITVAVARVPAAGGGGGKGFFAGLFGG